MDEFRCDPIALLILIASLSGGCAPQMRYEPGDSPRVFKAPQNGQYDLCAKRDDVPIWSAFLLKGDAVGFARDANAQLVAVADIQRHSLPERRYQWLHVEPAAQPERGTSNSLRTVGPIVVETAAKVAVAAVLYSPLWLIPAAARASQGSATRHAPRLR